MATGQAQGADAGGVTPWPPRVEAGQVYLDAENRRGPCRFGACGAADANRA